MKIPEEREKGQIWERSPATNSLCRFYRRDLSCATDRREKKRERREKMRDEDG